MKIRAFWLLTILPLAVHAADHWVATWMASPSLPPVVGSTGARPAQLAFDHQTIRQIAHVSLGGRSFRLKLANTFGTQALAIGSTHVGRQAQQVSIVPGSDRRVTFGGLGEVVIPPGAVVLSDPVELEVASGGNLAISLYLSGPVTATTVHFYNQQHSYLAAGDLTAAETFTPASTVSGWVYLTAIDVNAPAAAAAIVPFGDSITDGYASTDDANLRWPDQLAARLLTSSPHRPLAVANAGLSGNRVLHDAPKRFEFGVSALARFDRDVLAQAGVGYLIVLEGVNDLNHPGGDAPLSEKVSAEDLIAGYRQLISRAHEKDIKVFGCTILPFGGSGEKEAVRARLNVWMRESHAFDGVIDFDQATRDPAHPTQLLASYDCGDHVHPNDAGYRVMANAIDLSWFR